jgi:hypothetical protein
MLIEIGDVWWIGSTAFGQYERHAEPDALIGIGCQSSTCGRLLVGFSKPLFAILPSLCEIAELSFGICYFSQPRNSDFQPEHVPRLIAKEQVGKSVSGYQRHAPRTPPAPPARSRSTSRCSTANQCSIVLTSARQLCIEASDRGRGGYSCGYCQPKQNVTIAPTLEHGRFQRKPLGLGSPHPGEAIGGSWDSAQTLASPGFYLTIPSLNASPMSKVMRMDNVGGKSPPSWIRDP